MSFLERLQEAQCEGLTARQRLVERIISEFEDGCLRAARATQGFYGHEVRFPQVLKRIGLVTTSAAVQWELIQLVCQQVWAALDASVRIEVWIFGPSKRDVYPVQSDNQTSGQGSGGIKCRVKGEVIHTLHLSMNFPEPSADGLPPAETRSNLSQLCAVCLETNPVVALTPCGHLICTRCVRRLAPTQGCPVCRSPVIGHQNLFVS
uniref:RING-type domain-containing protein n=1 Tax=Alexandrium monilatum TaxID=311494 RepID=A0A7S4SKV8_9DINO